MIGGQKVAVSGNWGDSAEFDGLSVLSGGGGAEVDKRFSVLANFGSNDFQRGGTEKHSAMLLHVFGELDALNFEPPVGCAGSVPDAEIGV